MGDGLTAEAAVADLREGLVALIEEFGRDIPSREIPKGTLRNILSLTGISVDELNDLM